MTPVDPDILREGILYEDDDLIAVNKPAGVVVHPTYKHPANTLLDALRAYAADWPASDNPTIVGRLDKLTSGIVLAAKHARAHAALQVAEKEKSYLAIVIGEVEIACGEIDLSLRVDPADRRRVIVSPDSGRASLTRFERLASRDGVTLLRCRLVTGRRHQLRAHLAARGWPIVGDPVYGRARSGLANERLATAVDACPRQALHAWRLGFIHPMSGERIGIEAPTPADFNGLMDACGFAPL